MCHDCQLAEAQSTIVAGDQVVLKHLQAAGGQLPDDLPVEQCVHEHTATEYNAVDVGRGRDSDQVCTIVVASVL